MREKMRPLEQERFIFMDLNAITLSFIQMPNNDCNALTKAMQGYSVRKTETIRVIERERGRGTCNKRKRKYHMTATNRISRIIISEYGKRCKM